MQRNGNGDVVESFSKGIPLASAFEFLFENASDAIYILDVHGNFVAVNRKAEELTGFKREDFIGKPFRKIIPVKSMFRASRGFLKVVRGKSIRIELELKTAFGKTIPVEATSTPLIVDGKIAGTFGIVREITEQKQIEEALRKEKAKFQTFLNLIADPVVIVDSKGNFLEANDRIREITGYEKEELLGKSFSQTNIVSATSKKILLKNLARRMMGMTTASYEIEVQKKDGGKEVSEVSAVKIEYEGKPADLVVLRNITERKKMEENLSALNLYGKRLNSAVNFRQVYELTLDALEKTLGFENATFMIEDKGNLRIASYRGYPEPLSLKLPLDGTKKGITVRAAKTRKPMLVANVEKDADYVPGSPGIRSELAVPIEIENKVLGVLNVESKEVGAFGEKDVMLLQILASHAATAVSNIEKRKEIEKRSSQLTSVLKSSVAMISSTDLRQRLQEIAEAIRGVGWRRVVISLTDENLDIKSRDNIVTCGVTDEEREFLWKNRQPGEVWRERLGPQYKRFKIGEFFYLPWSDPWVRQTFSKDTLASRLKPEDMVDWDPQDLLYAPFRLAEGRIVGVLSIDDPSDGRRPTKESLAPLELFLHQAAVAIENVQLIQQLNKARDQIKEYADHLEMKVKQRTQELIEAQNRLLKTERMAAIGELAAMVGHDLRNPLTGIDVATYYLKTKLESKKDRKTAEMIKLIEKNIQYSNNIITDLLEYSREIRLETVKASPKSIVKAALSLAKIPENVQVIDSTLSEPKIEVDVEKMKRVFVNIIKNAVEAMPEGGMLTITSRTSMGNLEIAFKDNGVGMDKEVFQKLWTPFFTTKAKGMGLGLSICKRFVEAHGGSISVESDVGKGTTFTVIIPVEFNFEGGEKSWLKPQESLLSTTTKA